MGLNAKQKEAVEYLEGPLLVLAGPGTGKTQLLSEKVAYILKNTDTAPENILCLTFTETGASNMRERLKSMIGMEGLKVNIGTYHAFGSEILAKYKNYAVDYERRLDAAIDEVTQFKIVKDLRDKLPGRDILRGDNAKDIISVISEAKAAGLEARDLEKVAEQNEADSKVLSRTIAPFLEQLVPRKFKESYERAYLPIYEVLKPYENAEMILGNVERSIGGMARDLKDAMIEAESKQRLTPLSGWKDKYFEKDGRGRWRLSDRVANKKLFSIARVMGEYQQYLLDNGLYDFDDMIQEAGRVLREDEGFRLTMQERYQYIMLDEFQDTNQSQLAIVKLLTDYEKPLVMAVGDDDQAIYEFQGARSTNLTDFQEHYGAHVIALTENYRSTQEILNFAHDVIEGAPDRFGEKLLTANLPDPEESQITRVEFLSADQEYEFVASKIHELILAGVPQSKIAVISYKAKYFMPLLPYLKAHEEIKIAYEKRDNLFEDEQMRQLFNVAKFVVELTRQRKTSVSVLELLSYPFWGLPMLEVVRLTGEAREKHEPVFEYLCGVENASIKEAMEFLTGLVAKATTLPLETVISEIVERMEIEKLDAYEQFRFYENLASLLSRAKKHFGERALFLVDLVEMLEDYEAAEMPMNVVSPYRDADEAVQILTAHRSKGLEFEYVFIIAADHTAWGKGKGNNNMLALPRNLTQIRHTGTTDGEKMRILYVALTRAKTHLYITNSLHDFMGKSPERLEYFEERVEKLPDGTEVVMAPFLPSKRVILDYDGANRGADDYSGVVQSIDRLKNYVKAYAELSPDMRAIYEERVKGLRLSASTLTSFIDIVNAGPQEFFRRQILRVPPEPEDESLAIGNLMHATFEQVTKAGISDEEAVQYFLSELEKRDLEPELREKIREVGPAELAVALETFSEILRTGRAEVDFGPEHLVVSGVPVTGKIDHIVVDEEARTVEIYDFKTGKYRKDKWTSHATLYKYAMQLMFYKMLLLASREYAGYAVTRAHILFVRPDEDGVAYDRVYEFDEETEAEFSELLVTVYGLIESLRFMEDPEVFVATDKSLKLADIKKFIKLLLAKGSEL